MEIAGGENAGIKNAEAFKAGIKYRSPSPLMGTSGKNWVFQPHPELYELLAKNVLEHYACYKNSNIDKTCIPTYFYLGGAGTGKSRHASEFASSVQKAITLRTQHPLYHDLARRLKTAFVFHVSFGNGTSLTVEEMSNPWNAIGTRMLRQVLGKPIDHICKRYVADPRAVFRLIAAAKGVDLYDDFTGILVVDGIQKVLTEYDDGRNNTSTFYRLLSQIGDLSLVSRDPSKTEGETLRDAAADSDSWQREAPFIMTCVTATCFGPVQEFLADSRRKCVYLPLNRLDAPTWKKDNSPVLNNSPIARLLVNDVGGHARAIELIADVLAKYQNEVQPNITELANAIYAGLRNRYSKAVSMLQRHILPIVQCVLSRQQIRLQDVIPGSDLRWEHITASGLIWFERTEAGYDYDALGYLVAPYIWLWIFARLSPSENTQRLSRFLENWQFNDYAELLHLTTGEGLRGNTPRQSFEEFCCSFRILRSLGFEDGQEMPLKLLHSGCKLRDDRETIVVNRHLNVAEALQQYTRHSGTSNADAQLSHVTLNGTSAAAGDFFLGIESPNGMGSQSKIVREVGQCKLIRKKLTQDAYNAERNKSAGPDDIFMLYTDAEISDDFALPDRSGLVDASCWDSYFGPFSGRAYMALQYSSSKD